ncbi:MAG: YdcF family protein, partial [Actinobacteria bacterium]|nr:YdcF family protein [Actinomycetota bacterium]
MRLIKWAILIVIAAPLLLVTATGADVWFSSKQDQRSQTQAIVVLGAAQYNGVPSTIFRARLDHARVLYNDRVAPLIVVLGGKRPGDRFTEAQAGAAYLEKSLPASKVTGVMGGNSTIESLQLFKYMAESKHINKITIVSDPLHLA